MVILKEAFAEACLRDYQKKTKKFFTSYNFHLNKTNFKTFAVKTFWLLCHVSCRSGE